MCVQVIRMDADNMMTVMERAVEAGHSVLIENMGESIDAVLNPVITRWGSASAMPATTSSCLQLCELAWHCLRCAVLRLLVPTWPAQAAV
jgi:hypothetical protein